MNPLETRPRLLQPPPPQVTKTTEAPNCYSQSLHTAPKVGDALRHPNQCQRGHNGKVGLGSGRARLSLCCWGWVHRGIPGGGGGTQPSSVHGTAVGERSAGLCPQGAAAPQPRAALVTQTRDQ